MPGFYISLTCLGFTVDAISLTCLGFFSPQARHTWVLQWTSSAWHSWVLHICWIHQGFYYAGHACFVVVAKLDMAEFYCGHCKLHVQWNIMPKDCKCWGLTRDEGPGCKLVWNCVQNNVKIWSWRGLVSWGGLSCKIHCVWYHLCTCSEKEVYACVSVYVSMCTWERLKEKKQRLILLSHLK